MVSMCAQKHHGGLSLSWNFVLGVVFATIPMLSYWLVFSTPLSPLRSTPGVLFLASFPYAFKSSEMLALPAPVIHSLFSGVFLLHTRGDTTQAEKRNQFTPFHHHQTAIHHVYQASSTSHATTLSPLHPDGVYHFFILASDPPVICIFRHIVLLLFRGVHVNKIITLSLYRKCAYSCFLSLIRIIKFNANLSFLLIGLVRSLLYIMGASQWRGYVVLRRYVARWTAISVFKGWFSWGSTLHWLGNERPALWTQGTLFRRSASSAA